VVEVLSGVSPDCCTFYAAGDMLLSVSLASVDVSGSVFLKRDFAKGSAEGDVNATIDCSSVIGGLTGTGQATWYIDKDIQYVQGRLRASVCGWTGGAGLEGGLFIGHNCPRDKAWVLKSTTGRFGVSANQLPDPLTGFYAYGQASFDVNYWLFGGGIELYAGMGAFTQKPSDASIESAWNSGFGLPYVVGCAGCCVHGEILGGLVSASGWANLVLGGPIPIRFEGKFGLEGCVLWVLCASVEVTAGLGNSGFYLN
jgi:hypothetical protein